MKVNLTILLILFSNLILFAQNDSIQYNLTRKYFKKELKNYKSVLIGEAKDQNYNPKKISKDAAFSFETLSLSGNEAVIAINIKEKDKTQDLYAFWIKDREWKIKAFRALWLPGMFYMMLDQYKDLDENGIEKAYDNIIIEIKASRDSIVVQGAIEDIGTLEDFQFEIKNMKLTVASDSMLIDYFNQNKDKFNSLLTKIKADTSVDAKRWRFTDNSNYKIDMHEILITSIADYDNKITNFVIGGMIDNTVGYFYCESPKNLPVMTDHRYIMIRSLENGWYLYKTT